jgi:hypothetical protein
MKKKIKKITKYITCVACSSMKMMYGQFHVGFFSVFKLLNNNDNAYFRFLMLVVEKTGKIPHGIAHLHSFFISE